MWLTCLQCGQTYFGSGKFCTAKCESDYLNPPVRKIVNKRNVCRFCGQPIEKGLYCSEECRKENNRDSYLVKLVCVICNKNFVGRPGMKYCSPECRLIGFRAKTVKSRCRVCGKPCPNGEACCSWKCAVEFNAER